MSLYIADHLRSKTVYQVLQSPIEWLKEQSNQQSLHQSSLLLDPQVKKEDKLNELSVLKRQNMPFLYASAFGAINDPKRPSIAPRKVSENGGVLRQFIALDYDFNEGDEALSLALQEQIPQLFKGINYALYPSSSFPLLPRFRFVVETKEWFDKKTYASAAEHLIHYIGINTNDFKANTTLAHAFNGPWYWHQDARKVAQFVTKYETLSLESIGWKPPKQKESPIITYREDHLLPALEDLDLDALQEYDQFWPFVESLADAFLKGLVSQPFVDQALQVVAGGNPKWEEENPRLFQEQKDKLLANPTKRAYVKPLGTYLPMVQEVKKQDPSVNNLAQLLTSLLPANFQGDPSLEIKEACDIIRQFFEFGLLPDIDSNKEALAIFNPLSGLWVHNEDDLIAMLSVVKPAISQVQVNTALMYWAALANQQNRYLKPYSGSQYLAFKNGVLDITTLELHDLNSDLVKRLELTSRHLLQIDYLPNPPLINYEKDGMNGADWNVESFIQAYANNNSELREYLLFGLALGLFPNHTFGVTFDIQGESGSGKSTLSTLFKGFYGPSRVQEIIFGDMNKDFPLNSYNYDTTVIWAKECNVGSNTLSEEYGVNFYDSLSDLTARLPVKHSGDLIISNPPQLFVDGTVFISAEELNSGVSRRTLAYKLPSPMDPLRSQYYSMNITERLLAESTLQYLVVEMIKAYKSFVPEYRWSNFKMNLLIKEDLELLPKEARTWRYEFVSADANIRLFYEEQLREYLLVDDPDAWLSDDFFHRIYLAYYAQKNPQDKNGRYARRLQSFTKILHQIFEEDHLYRIEYRDSTMRNRKRLSNFRSWGFNWDEFLELWMMPDRLKNENAPEIYSKKTTQLYRLVSIPPVGMEQDESGSYIPNQPTRKER